MLNAWLRSVVARHRIPTSAGQTSATILPDCVRNATVQFGRSGFDHRLISRDSAASHTLRPKGWFLGGRRPRRPVAGLGLSRPATHSLTQPAPNTAAARAEQARHRPGRSAGRVLRTAADISHQRADGRLARRPAAQPDRLAWLARAPAGRRFGVSLTGRLFVSPRPAGASAFR